MKDNGFSLTELIVVMAIAGILLAIGTLQFNNYMRKSGIESQFRSMLADLSNVRSQALFMKRDRSVTISASEYRIYSTANISVSPLVTKSLKYRITSDNMGTFTFDSRGILSSLPGDDMSVCLESYDDIPSIDSLVLSPMLMKLGKRDTTGCSSDHITIK